MKTLAMFVGTALALAPMTGFAVPLSDPVNAEFYSFQLRGLSYGPTGESVGVHVYDDTFDSSAYGSVTIMDLTTSTTLYSFTSGDYGVYQSPGTYDTTPIVLPYGDMLQYSFAGQEFSNMSIIFGGSVVASGGDSNGAHPSYTTTEVIPNPVPEPATLAVLATGLIVLSARRRR